MKITVIKGPNHDKCVDEARRYLFMYVSEIAKQMKESNRLEEQ